MKARRMDEGVPEHRWLCCRFLLSTVGQVDWKGQGKHSDHDLHASEGTSS